MIRAASLSAIVAFVRRKFADVPQMSSLQLTELLDKDNKKILLLDARPAHEFEVSHLKSAVRVAHDDMTEVEKAVQLAKKQQPDLIVCYCSVGYRSCILAAKLAKREAVSCPVYNLEGSLFKWANEQWPMVDGSGQPTPYAHQFARAWGLLLRPEFRGRHT